MAGTNFGRCVGLNAPCERARAHTHAFKPTVYILVNNQDDCREPCMHVTSLGPLRLQAQGPDCLRPGDTVTIAFQAVCESVSDPAWLESVRLLFRQGME